MMGPTGVGKTHLSTALGIHAIERGYQVSFISMNCLIYVLKSIEYISKSKTRYNRIIKSDLIITNDVMYMAYEPQDAHFMRCMTKLHLSLPLIKVLENGESSLGILHLRQLYWIVSSIGVKY